MAVLERIAGWNNLRDEINNLHLFLVKSLVWWEFVVGLLSNCTHLCLAVSGVQRVDWNRQRAIAPGLSNRDFRMVILPCKSIGTQLLPVTWLCCCCGLGGLDNLWKGRSKKEWWKSCFRPAPADDRRCWSFQSRSYILVLQQRPLHSWQSQSVKRIFYFSDHVDTRCSVIMISVRYERYHALSKKILFDDNIFF